MTSAQNGAGQIIEAALAWLAPISLPMPLRVIMPVASDGGAVTVRAADALGPAMLAHQLIAFRVVNQRRELHQAWQGPEQHRSTSDESFTRLGKDLSSTGIDGKVSPQPIFSLPIAPKRPPPRKPGRAKDLMLY